MTFPKALMTIKELIPMGFSDDQLRRIARESKEAGYAVVIRETCSKTAPLKFDTEELAKYIKRQTKLWENANA